MTGRTSMPLLDSVELLNERLLDKLPGLKQLSNNCTQEATQGQASASSQSKRKSATTPLEVRLRATILFDPSLHFSSLCVLIIYTASTACLVRIPYQVCMPETHIDLHCPVAQPPARWGPRGRQGAAAPRRGQGSQSSGGHRRPEEEAEETSESSPPRRDPVHRCHGVRRQRAAVWLLRRGHQPGVTLCKLCCWSCMYSKSN